MSNKRWTQFLNMWRFAQFGTICIILKNLKNTHGGVLLLVTLFHGFFFTFFKLYKLYQIAQSVALPSWHLPVQS